ncbi:hypothetical protein M9R32_09130 [Paenisporosarcina quisquiliarum]|uniref:Uncharacterized protein n=1 Tax=Paenisporosarcina quisquiliarum TaxID=365346 RepID=A0A9X3LG99_9BACL|nr:hypothetical protein [Paenisporosarcina quisquiliarum]MCZ8537341.1 hypothetical protein [Paenisporosarcina quisquiliarum]
MKKIFVMWLFILLIISGCSMEVQEFKGPTSESASYAAILIVNGDQYLSVGTKNQGEYTLGEEVGKVATRLPPEVLPKDDFASNYLDEGTIIYSVKEDNEVFLVETNEEDVYEVFEKSS